MGLVRPVGVPSISETESSLRLAFGTEITQSSTFGVDFLMAPGLPNSFFSMDFSNDSESLGGVNVVATPNIILNISLIIAKFFVSLSLVSADAVKIFVVSVKVAFIVSVK